ncbi:hypothetical protein M752DRAFT_21982 [Aspergillus phoenicis ATCC 13157]|uniref:Uncharacterized protein n=1 Tax=Aspergillus phoenicis ATCC 13157 TaxID=1353007 RepID=A0A370PJ65_ASPPH|nr:hypothetical protein M752DRAFT_21982 [Aspergillus phoenicis ATCC 13157]
MSFWLSSDLVLSYSKVCSSLQFMSLLSCARLHAEKMFLYVPQQDYHERWIIYVNCSAGYLTLGSPGQSSFIMAKTFIKYIDGLALSGCNLTLNTREQLYGCVVEPTNPETRSK